MNSDIIVFNIFFMSIFSCRNLRSKDWYNEFPKNKWSISYNEPSKK